MRTAIVYDRVNKWGGAERVLVALHNIFPDAPLYTSVYNPVNASWARAFPNIYTSFIQKLPGAKSRHELIPFLMPIAFETFDFSDYDLVISVTSEFAKGIITTPKTKHVCYLLTPTRYLWSGYDEYFSNSLFRALTKPLINYLRYWDMIASKRPDMVISISKEVQKRVKRYYGIDSKVIYPPLFIDRYNITRFTTKLNGVKYKNYFLVVSRLVKYKKVDIAIRVFNQLNYPLVVIGKGKEEKYLKSIAGSNVYFLKNLTDRKLANYYYGARALVMPQLEDFGLVSIEAQSYGTPVIAYAKGGALDTVNKETGIIFNDQTKAGLSEAILRFNQQLFDREAIIKNTKRFSFRVFQQKLLKTINEN
ncbi:glycosyltransferase [Candidatus Woesebacteria bacterium]|nr:MAG: glycosyltransferase [Candidatus Woesebacteria bacterium]